LLFWKDEDLEYIWDLIREIPLDFLAPSSSIVTDDLVKRAHSLNKVVYAYMVNDIPTYNKLILMGVDEI
jgi:glycerophosphoryl diester phosphodiesterase